MYFFLLNIVIVALSIVESLLKELLKPIVNYRKVYYNKVNRSKQERTKTCSKGLKRVKKTKGGAFMFSALELSKYIVSKCNGDAMPITNLQLQKILYYIQKEFLRVGPPAFAERIEAWKFGPVVPDVYYYFAGNGAMPITDSYDVIINNSIIDAIVKSKRDLDPWELVQETHKEGGAWSKIFKNGEGNKRVIPIELIRQAG
ncbi:MAG: DUF4065 domain-containing protein [Oscillospiraceae bacterium]